MNSVYLTTNEISSSIFPTRNNLVLLYPFHDSKLTLNQCCHHNYNGQPICLSLRQAIRALTAQRPLCTQQILVSAD